MHEKQQFLNNENWLLFFQNSRFWANDFCFGNSFYLFFSIKSPILWPYFYYYYLYLRTETNMGFSIAGSEPIDDVYQSSGPKNVISVLGPKNSFSTFLAFFQFYCRILKWKYSGNPIKIDWTNDNFVPCFTLHINISLKSIQIQFWPAQTKTPPRNLKTTAGRKTPSGRNY